MTYLGICEICKTEVKPPQRPAYPVQGWEVKRTQGGANQILARERIPNRIAHERCVERLSKRGEQLAL